MVMRGVLVCVEVRCGYTTTYKHTQIKTPNHHNHSLSEDPLVRLCLHPPLEGALVPGATLSGTLDLRTSHAGHHRDASTPQCLLLAVTLESEEVVADKWLQSSRSGIVRKVRVCDGLVGVGWSGGVVFAGQKKGYR